MATYAAMVTASCQRAGNDKPIAATISTTPTTRAVATLSCAGGDRPLALRRMAPIGFDVRRVVQEVGAAGGEAEADERDDRLEQRGAVRQHAGRAGRGEDQHVLRPLPGPGRADRAPRPTTVRARPDRDRGARPLPAPSRQRRRRRRPAVRLVIATPTRAATTARGRWRNAAIIQRNSGGTHTISLPDAKPGDDGVGDGVGGRGERRGLHARGHLGVDEAGPHDHAPARPSDEAVAEALRERVESPPSSSRTRSSTCGPLAGHGADSTTIVPWPCSASPCAAASPLDTRRRSWRGPARPPLPDRRRTRAWSPSTPNAISTRSMSPPLEARPDGGVVRGGVEASNATRADRRSRRLRVIASSAPASSAGRRAARTTVRQPRPTSRRRVVACAMSDPPPRTRADCTAPSAFFTATFIEP